jgi:hypothetical protein
LHSNLRDLHGLFVIKWVRFPAELTCRKLTVCTSELQPHLSQGLQEIATGVGFDEHMLRLEPQPLLCAARLQNPMRQVCARLRLWKHRPLTTWTLLNGAIPLHQIILWLACRWSLGVILG